MYAMKPGVIDKYNQTDQCFIAKLEFSGSVYIIF